MKKKKLMKLVKQGILFMLFEMVFLGITMPLVAFYGPFERVKQVLVKSAMETGKHKYIAKLFLSDKEITKIVGNEKNSLKTVATDTSRFKSDNSIQVEEINTNKMLSGYMMMVHNPKRIKVGFNVPSMSIDSLAAKYGCMDAINGGGFSIFSNGKPCGYIIIGGEVKYSDRPDYNKKQDAMALTDKGKLLVGSYSINDLKQLNVKEALCFGPPLIVDGKEVAYKDDNSGISPRTAIGQKADGTILMLVLGERSMDNFGGTLQDVQQIMLQYGAINAINLDGGGSTGMVYNGENLKLGDAMVVGRAVPSFVYVK